MLPNGKGHSQYEKYNEERPGKPVIATPSMGQLTGSDIGRNTQERR
jgi:hypothetical protein